MRLTPAERDRLLLASAAAVARRRRERGLRLNVPETVALVADAAVEAAVEPWTEHLDGERLVVLGEIRHLGGAVRRGAADAPNDRARTAEHCLEYVTVQAQEHRRHAVERLYARTRDRLAPYVTGATYLNFTELAEKGARTASACGTGSWQRLRTLKSVLDPDDRFCHGFAVPPFDVPLAGVPRQRPREG